MKLGLRLSLIGAAFLFATPQVVSAAVVVVRSAGQAAKAYPPGKSLPEGASIKLGDGDMVTILSSNAARVFRGPGVFAVGADHEDLAMAAGRRARFGALRSGDIAQNPSIWDVDVTQSGKMCVADPAKLMLWRPNTDQSVKLNIRSSTGKAQSVDWAAGKSTASWPAALPISSGSEYEIQFPGADKNNVSFIKVPQEPTDVVVAAKLLIDNGCQNQLDLLVDNAAKAHAN